MLKDKRVVVSEMIETNKNDLTILDIKERFLSQKNILVGNQALELQLGALQRGIKDKKEWISWLEKYEEDLKKEK